MKVFNPKVEIKFAHIETEKLAEEWSKDFIEWIESRKEKVCCVIQQYVEE